jgi:ribonucleoside-diphosphate reductase alpha chain
MVMESFLSTRQKRRSMSVVNLKNQSNNNIQPALQPASQDIWDKKYRLKKMNGDAVDADIHATFKRVARALADVESDDTDREKYYERFLWALENGAIPAGRIISNAGAQAHKPATSTINCTVAGVVPEWHWL